MTIEELSEKRFMEAQIKIEAKRKEFEEQIDKSLETCKEKTLRRFENF